MEFKFRKDTLIIDEEKYGDYHKFMKSWINDNLQLVSDVQVRIDKFFEKNKSKKKDSARVMLPESIDIAAEVVDDIMKDVSHKAVSILMKNGIYDYQEDDFYFWIFLDGDVCVYDQITPEIIRKYAYNFKWARSTDDDKEAEFKMWRYTISMRGCYRLLEHDLSYKVAFLHDICIIGSELADTLKNNNVMEAPQKNYAGAQGVISSIYQHAKTNDEKIELLFGYYKGNPYNIFAFGELVRTIIHQGGTTEDLNDLINIAEYLGILEILVGVIESSMCSDSTDFSDKIEPGLEDKEERKERHKKNETAKNNWEKLNLITANNHICLGENYPKCLKYIDKAADKCFNYNLENTNKENKYIYQVV